MNDKMPNTSSPCATNPATVPPGGKIAAGSAPDLTAFTALARQAFADLPALFAPHITRLVLVVEDVADADVLSAMGIDHPYALTGLYEGRPLTERSISDNGVLPDRVTLYRLPILIEWVESGERLDDLVRHVLIHEIGHYFGFSNAQMDALERAAP